MDICLSEGEANIALAVCFLANRVVHIDIALRYYVLITADYLAKVGVNIAALIACRHTGENTRRNG